MQSPGVPHAHQFPVLVWPANATVANGVELIELTRGAVEKNIGKQSMQSVANRNLIFTNVSSLDLSAEARTRLGAEAFYQHVVARLINGFHSKQLLTQLGDQLVLSAEQAYSVRQMDKLEMISNALLDLPLSPSHHKAANYFHGVRLSRFGQFEDAKRVFEAVAEGPIHGYTGRAIHAWGTIYKLRGDFDTAIRSHIEASRIATLNGRFDLHTEVFVQRNLAVIRSIDGDHHGSLSHLEQIHPLVNTLALRYPAGYYDYLNSVAVELGELGRLEEARRTAQRVINSPYAVRFPEWRETFDEIVEKQRRRTRSAIIVPQGVLGYQTERTAPEAENLFRLPARPLSDQQYSEGKLLVDSSSQTQRARVLSFESWKPGNAIRGRSGGSIVTPKDRARMTTGQKLIRLMDLVSQEDTDDETIERILQAVEQILAKRRGERVD